MRESLKELKLEVVFLVALLALFMGQVLRFGYFKYDDFQMIQMLEDKGFWRLLITPHGDQGVFGLRVAFGLLWKVFGTQAWGWNLCILGTFFVLGLLVLDQLRRLGVEKFYRILALCSLYSWVLWVEMSYGYYCLLMYPWIVIFYLGAARMWENFLASNRYEKLALSLFLLLAAASISIAAAWVLPAYGLLILLHYKTKTFKDKKALCAVAGLASVGIAFFLYQYFLVIKTGIFLSQKSTLTHTPLLQRFFDFFIGWELSVFLPYYYYVTQNIGLSKVALFGGALFFVAFAGVKASSKEVRTKILALLSSALVYSLMVVAGRSWDGFKSWSSKYEGNFYVLILPVFFLLIQNIKIRALRLAVVGACALGILQSLAIRFDLPLANWSHYYAHKWQRDAAVERKEAIVMLNKCLEPLSADEQYWVPSAANVRSFNEELGDPYELCVYFPFLPHAKVMKWNVLDNSGSRCIKEASVLTDSGGKLIVPVDLRYCLKK